MSFEHHEHVRDGSTIGFELEYRFYSAESLQELPSGYEISLTSDATSEFKQSVYELATPVCRAQDLVLAAHTLQERAASLAFAHGGMPLASSMPLNLVGLNAISPDERYQLQARFAGGLSDPSPTGFHVHVNVQDLETRVRVRDRLSAYEHVLTAVSASSPFENGFNARVASARTERFGLLPSVFDPLWSDDAEEHLLQLRQHLKATGYLGVISEPKVFRFAHPRTRVSFDEKPTVEMRVFDMPLTTDDLLLSLYLGIGLANAVLSDIEDGLPPRAQRVVHIEHPAMRKQAAVFGIEGELHHPESGERLPAWVVLDDVFRYAEMGLQRFDQTGTAASVFERLVDGLRQCGTGASRLRRLHAAIHHARSDAGLEVAPWSEWEAGHIAMSPGTARDLVAGVIGMNLAGMPASTEVLEDLRRASVHFGDGKRSVSAVLVERHERRLLRAQV